MRPPEPRAARILAAPERHWTRKITTFIAWYVALATLFYILIYHPLLDSMKDGSISYTEYQAMPLGELKSGVEDGFGAPPGPDWITLPENPPPSAPAGTSCIYYTDSTYLQSPVAEYSNFYQFCFNTHGILVYKDANLDG